MWVQDAGWVGVLATDLAALKAEQLVQGQKCSNVVVMAA